MGDGVCHQATSGMGGLIDFLYSLLFYIMCNLKGREKWEAHVDKMRFESLVCRCVSSSSLTWTWRTGVGGFWRRKKGSDSRDKEGKKHHTLKMCFRQTVKARTKKETRRKPQPQLAYLSGVANEKLGRQLTKREKEKEAHAHKEDKIMVTAGKVSEFYFYLLLNTGSPPTLILQIFSWSWLRQRGSSKAKPSI